MGIKSLVSALSLLIFSCCTKDEKKTPKEFSVHNFNLVLVPDLSNRINPEFYPKPLHDSLIIGAIYKNISGKFLAVENRKSNQKDTYKLDFLNRETLNSGAFKVSDFSIDLNKFQNNQLDRVDYINDGLEKDVSRIEKEVGQLYKDVLRKPFGADIYSYLNNSVNYSLEKNESKKVELSQGAINVISTRNIVVLFTDGYIENGNKEKGYNLGVDDIEAIRKAFLQSGEGDLSAFLDKNPGFQLVPLSNRRLKEVNLLVIELFDRSLKNGTAIKHPTDMEIIKAVWRKWLEKSHVGSYDFLETQTDSENVVIKIADFMKNPGNGSGI